MFMIQINDYTNSVDKSVPVATYSDTLYDTYESAKDDIHNLVLNEIDNYNDKNITFDLIATDSFDARIINSLGETEYEYIIMELVRKKPV